MSRKILSAVTPLAALVAFAALPAIAQAGTQLQAGGKEMPVGAVIKGQGSFGVDIQNEKNEIAEEWECLGSVLEGEVTKNQGADAQASIAEVKMGTCTWGKLKADVTTNASLAAPWTLQFQEPEEQPFTFAHILPSAGSSLIFKAGIQVAGVTVNCEYTAGSVQFAGLEVSDVWKIEGTKQLTRKAGFELCGTFGDLEGNFQFENNKAEGVIVDMT